jgi:predicted metal-dependent HD superfamily phosphohydrolase
MKLSKYKKHITQNDFNKLLIYESADRHFHTFEHLKTMFEWLDYSINNTCDLEENDIKLLYIAVWYHDAVYDTKSDTNEEDSCTMYLKSDTAKSLTAHDNSIICDLIMATKYHELKPGDTLHNLIVLADLNMLINYLTPEKMIRLEKQVRSEYSYVNELVYCYYRIIILKKINRNIKLNIKNNIKYLRQRMANYILIKYKNVIKY